jgi:hypothetical protein
VVEHRAGNPRTSFGLALSLLTLGSAGFALGSAGCGSARQLSGSMHAYEVGNYHQAAERCDNVDETTLDQRRQVRYYVYCGLTYYRLGDEDSARALLSTGRQMYDSGSPTWLKPIIVDQMNKALGSLSGPTYTPAPYMPSWALGPRNATSAAGESHDPSE